MSEINRSSGVLTIKIRKGAIMTGMMACFVCGLGGKLANEGFSLSLTVFLIFSLPHLEDLISRPLISCNNQ